jgi:hypothetical protein
MGVSHCTLICSGQRIVVSTIPEPTLSVDDFSSRSDKGQRVKLAGLDATLSRRATGRILMPALNDVRRATALAPQGSRRLRDSAQKGHFQQVWGNRGRMLDRFDSAASYRTSAITGGERSQRGLRYLWLTWTYSVCKVGASIPSDKLKCELKPVAGSSYKARFGVARAARLKAFCPNRTCSWRRADGTGSHRVPCRPWTQGQRRCGCSHRERLHLTTITQSGGRNACLQDWAAKAGPSLHSALGCQEGRLASRIIVITVVFIW